MANNQGKVTAGTGKQGPGDGALHVRKMSVDDLREVLAIEESSFPTPWSGNMFVQEINAANSRSLVATIEDGRGDSVVGYIVYLCVADEVHLHNFAVRTDVRGRGIGATLMDAMFRHSRAEGARKATLEVRPSNGEAIKLYEKFGFVVKGVRPLYYSDTDEDALIMWADLGSESEDTIHG